MLCERMNGLQKWVPRRSERAREASATLFEELYLMSLTWDKETIRLWRMRGAFVEVWDPESPKDDMI
jgi:hypothetical protein